MDERSPIESTAEPGHAPLFDWPAIAALSALFAASWLLVASRANAPIIDDWVYAWSVEQLLRTGRLQVLDISAVYPVTQILWGAAFARIGGFSFVTLRASTVVVSAIGCYAIYLTLRELGCRRATSLLGAAALAFDPAYFALSFSFMTEVPFVSGSALAICSYVRGVRRGQSSLVWVGGAFALATFLIRPVAIVLPLAAAPAVAWGQERRSALARLAPVAATLLIMVVLQVALPRIFGPLTGEAVRRENLRWWFTVPAVTDLRWTTNVVFVAAFPFATLLLPYALRWPRIVLVATIALVLAGASRLLLGGLSMPLPNWQTWSLQDIAARSMIGGDVGPSAWSARLVPAIKILGLGVVASLALIVVRGSAVAPRWGRAEWLLVLVGLGHLTLIDVLWLFNDRYYLVLAPTLVILAARALDDHRIGRWIAAACVVVWAAIGVTGTRDMLAYSDAAALAAHDLEASGIPPWDIDAGWSVNGWRLYAHPEHLRPGADRQEDVPFVTSRRPTRYSITSSPIAGADVVRTIPLDRATWQANRTLYVVRRR